MSNFPDFSSHGYQVIRELGHNYASGRVTYQAINTNTQIAVVIKQFQFAKSSSNWSGFKAYEREIQVMQGLNHPSISIPETLLEGKWEVAPHQNDSPHMPETHAWIYFQSAKFASNHTDCQITVDTSKLMADKTYNERLSHQYFL